MTDPIRLSLEQSVEFSRPRYYSIRIPAMMERPIRELFEHLKKIFGEDKLAKIPDDLNTLPDKFKDGKVYYFFASLRWRCGKVDCPHARWNGGEWERGRVYWFGQDHHGHRTGRDIVLLKD